MKRLYVSAELSNKLKIFKLRDQVYRNVGGSTHYKKVDPHITVLNPVAIKNGTGRKVKDEIESYELDNKKIDVAGLSVWKNISEPFIILLDVHSELDQLRNDMVDIVNKYKDGPLGRMRKPHITLFKTKGWCESIPEEKCKSIQREILNTNVNFDCEIRSIEAKLRG